MTDQELGKVNLEYRSANASMFGTTTHNVCKVGATQLAVSCLQIYMYMCTLPYILGRKGIGGSRMSIAA